MKRKRYIFKPEKLDSHAVGGVFASWSFGHSNTALDSPRIEPVIYDGPNPYKLRRTQKHVKQYAAILKRESELYSDRRYHEFVLENILAVEFANLKEITTDWIFSTHSKFSHPKLFPIGDGTYYRWDNINPSDDLNLAHQCQATPVLDDIANQVIQIYKDYQAEVRTLLAMTLKCKTENSRPNLYIIDDLGCLRVKSSTQGLELEWNSESKDFKEVVLRELVEFYYKHPYCFDMMVACKNCGKFIVPTDPRKEYCDQACRERFNNKKRKKALLPQK